MKPSPISSMIHGDPAEKIGQHRHEFVSPDKPDYRPGSETLLVIIYELLPFARAPPAKPSIVCTQSIPRRKLFRELLRPRRTRRSKLLRPRWRTRWTRRRQRSAPMTRRKLFRELLRPRRTRRSKLLRPRWRTRCKRSTPVCL